MIDSERLFACEADLVATLHQHGAGLFPGSSLAFSEVPSGFGIADLVFAKPAPSLPDRLVAGVDPLLSAKAIQLVLAFDAACSEEEVFQRAVIGLPYGRRLLRGLKAGGFFLDQTPHPALVPSFEHIVAIEAKLSDWRRAVLQAIRHRTWADEVYVALPQARLETLIGRHQVPVGVGLIGVEPDGKLTIVRGSPSIEIEPWRRMLVSEGLVARIRKGMPPSTPRSQAVGFRVAELLRTVPALPGR